MRFFLLLFSLSASLCFSQSFQNGSIITKDNQQIAGKVRFNPKAGERGVVWLKKDGGELIKYRASQVAGFVVPPGSRFTVVVEKATKDTVFAELQYEGAVRIARLDRLYVFSKGDEEIQAYLPLKDTPQMLELEVRDLAKQELALIGSLTDFMKDCPLDDGMQKRLRPISFTKIKNELVLYARCKDQPFTRLAKTTFRLGVVGGMQFPNVVFEPQWNIYEGDVSFFGGLELDIIPASFHARSALNVGLLYGQNNFSIREGAPAGFNNLQIDYSSIRIPVSIKLFMHPGHSGFFIQPGLQWSVNSDMINLFYQVDNIGVFGTLGVGWEQNVGGRNWLVGSVRGEYNLLPVYHVSDGTTGSQGGIQVTVGYRFHVGG